MVPLGHTVDNPAQIQSKEDHVARHIFCIMINTFGPATDDLRGSIWQIIAQIFQVKRSGANNRNPHAQTLFSFPKFFRYIIYLILPLYHMTDIK